ncbi:heat shock protein Hsp20 domain-containing protein [Cavenderia fasciculata]|uniref:Heat shock protein Hsp20 domain-containing protein n=1 Tax=Cavenderia fasciculata TaxID=261658 RepID=F4PTR3_CACFS|nr:heat shock protein Hsp20 domain-containing protein [Cavenderia fasciculata]EGG21733.1 heat shock protein Hsp20 domain-containing protein [Cavenderia fasciculata]|eukprot:XP_004359583.1 heat shock protein Hsp20 domain-containing protein [Cavenderia fasciculata]
MNKLVQSTFKSLAKPATSSTTTFINPSSSSMLSGIGSTTTRSFSSDKKSNTDNNNSQIQQHKKDKQPTTQQQPWQKGLRNNHFGDFEDAFSIFKQPFFNPKSTKMFDHDWEEFETPQFMRAPKTRLEEGDDQFCLTMEVPGLSKDDIKLSYSKNRLTVESKKVEETQDEKQGNKSTFKSHFFKSMTFPENNINTGNISAKVENGVLTINLPKLVDESKKSQEIKVE